MAFLPPALGLRRCGKHVKRIGRKGLAPGRGSSSITTGSGRIAAEILRGGALTLDPPGLAIEIRDAFTGLDRPGRRPAPAFAPRQIR